MFDFMGADSSAFGSYGQPFSVGVTNYRAGMALKDPKKVLAENVAALIEHRGMNNWQLAKEAKVGPASVTRVRDGVTAIGLDVLLKIAARFNLEGWQMLYPGLDPGRPPQDVRQFSEDAMDLARLVDQITDPTEQVRALAICRLALQGGAPRPTHEPPAVEPPAPAPTPKREKARRN